ncbi:type IV pilus assembly protein PilM [Vibrio rotiferianus]|uniref:type IV pilus assembly protein PilM n=1 Tax=Vibrio rotiferianus TaxID=190895 RepID=UPI00406A5032
MDKLLVTGIDITHRSLKAVILKPTEKSFSLLGFKEIVLNDDIVAENQLINHQEIVNTLKEIKKSLPLFHRKVAIAVPDSAVISKVLQLDSELEESEVEFAVAQAFSLQSPIPIDELSLDYVPCGGGVLAKNRQYQVFATRKDLVDSRVKLLEQAGLKPVVVDVHAQVAGDIWQLAAERFPEKGNFCLVDVRDRDGSITMFNTEGELFHKEFIWNSFEPLIQDKSLPDGEDAEIHATDRFNNEVAKRIQRQFQLYASVSGSNDIQGIWLSGSKASTPMLSETLSTRLNISCEILNIFEHFDIQLPPKRRRDLDGQSFTAAAGIAVRAIKCLRRGNASTC